MQDIPGAQCPEQTSLQSSLELSLQPSLPESTLGLDTCYLSSVGTGSMAHWTTLSNCMGVAYVCVQPFLTHTHHCLCLGSALSYPHLLVSSDLNGHQGSKPCSAHNSNCSLHFYAHVIPLAKVGCSLLMARSKKKMGDKEIQLNLSPWVRPPGDRRWTSECSLESHFLLLQPHGPLLCVEHWKALQVWADNFHLHCSKAP